MNVSIFDKTLILRKEELNMASSARIYNFSGVTYGNIEEVTQILRFKNGVSAWLILHDKDENKEPHIHFVLKCSTAHTESAIKSWFTQKVDGVQQNAFVEPCQSIRGCLRYLLHLDNPEKEMYSPDNVVVIGGSRAERTFADALNDNGEADRQYETVMSYTNHEITLHDAVKLCPELFIHKYVSIQKLVHDLRIEQTEYYTEEI